MLNRRRAVAAAALWAALPVKAQSPGWPNKVVKMMVGFPPGQGSDVLARFYAEELQKLTGQSFIVENKPGAGGTLAAAAVAAAPADGYTVLLTSSGPMAVAPHLYRLAYDPLKDLEPVALVSTAPQALMVRPDHPAKSIGDIVAMSRQKELFAGSGGNGVTNHLVLEMFKIETGSKIVHVPYKGGSAAITDLIGGRIDMMFESTAAALALARARSVRLIAVTSPSRYSETPEVPAMSEFYPGFEVMTCGLAAVPRGTPIAIVERLAKLLNGIMSTDAAQNKLRHMGIDVVAGTSPSSAKAYLAAEHSKWGRLIKAANIKLD